ncbi:hypothetical protein BDV41DRAFT_545967 [Aspergillus transmontanensis]|uniref:Uncharacterized protein n=1 Tax=Aspergillus transmontanensis TaxID=1034304 RepID=A0A5N6VNA0_9EURO|nr:hypothetical protein BDV41DRAFT_545967 [Aspergillus transmontanensis]
MLMFTLVFRKRKARLMVLHFYDLYLIFCDFALLSFFFFFPFPNSLYSLDFSKLRVIRFENETGREVLAPLLKLHFITILLRLLAGVCTRVDFLRL